MCLQAVAREAASMAPIHRENAFIADAGVTKLPPGDEWLFSGNMMKEVITAKGIKWHTRFVVLLQEYLTFSKHFEGSEADSSDHLPELEMSVENLRATFNDNDSNHDGELEMEEAKQAMMALNMFSTQQDFDRMFTLLDSDGSGTLDWTEFKVLVERQNVSQQILDCIPLSEITEVDFDIRKRNAGGQKGSFRGPHAADVGGGEHGFLQGLKTSVLGAVEAVTGLDLDGDGKTDNIVIPEYDPDTHELHLIIPTVEGGKNGGRVYVYVVPHEAAQEWVSSLTNACKEAAKRRQRRELEEVYGHSAWSYRRAQAAAIYNSFTFQMLTFVLITLGFIFDMAEAQVLPQDGSTEATTFFLLDIVITGAFTLELLVNLFAHSNNGFQPFFSRPANWFDGAIVLVSITNILLTTAGTEFGGDNTKLLRLLRIGRVVRLFSSLKDFQKLLTAITSSVLPVCNAFAILLTITAVYSVLGTTFFRNKNEEFFANFHTSLFTMVQVLTGDSWASGVSRSIFREGLTDPDVALFFVSYILIASVMLLNVVVAVLLDEFMQTVTRAKEEQERLEEIEQERRKITGCLDPLTRTLLTFEDEDDLTAKIDSIYDKLDEDCSGTLGFEELRDGLRDSLGLSNIYMTREDFDIVTENGRYVTQNEFNGRQFREMIKGELWRFSRRALNNVLSVTGDEQFRSTILMLKIFEISSSAADASILARLGSLQRKVDLIVGSNGGRDGGREDASFSRAGSSGLGPPGRVSTWEIAGERRADGSEGGGGGGEAPFLGGHLVPVVERLDRDMTRINAKLDLLLQERRPNGYDTHDDHSGAVAERDMTCINANLQERGGGGAGGGGEGGPLGEWTTCPLQRAHLKDVPSPKSAFKRKIRAGGSWPLKGASRPLRLSDSLPVTPLDGRGWTSLPESPLVRQNILGVSPLARNSLDAEEMRLRFQHAPPHSFENVRADVVTMEPPNPDVQTRYSTREGIAAQKVAQALTRGATVKAALARSPLRTVD